MKRFSIALLVNFLHVMDTLAQQPSQLAVHAANVSDWRRLSNGAERMNLVGRKDPSPTEFVAYRERYPADFMCDSTHISVHQHIGTQHIQVLRGTLVVGFGTDVNYAQAQAYGPGSYIVIPSGMPHFEWNRGTFEIHVDAVGMPRIAPVRRRDNSIDSDSPSTFVAAKCSDSRSLEPDAPANGVKEWSANRMILAGNPSSPTELYAFRIRYNQPASVYHYHYGTEHVVIWRGELRILFAPSVVDSTKAVSYGPGAFVEIPAGLPHAEWISGDLEAHVEFIGPTSATALDPKTHQPK